jgi:hypothetical protein
VVTRCTGIPANGCPLDGTIDVCADPTCAAAYACNPGGSWTLDHTCPGFRPDAGSDAGPDGQAAGPDAGPTACVNENLPPGASAIGGSQCIDLQPPDCPIGEVNICDSNGPNLCVTTGCQQLFYCQNSGENAGWQAWGYCQDDGGLTYAPAP